MHARHLCAHFGSCAYLMILDGRICPMFEQEGSKVCALYFLKRP